MSHPRKELFNSLYIVAGVLCAGMGLKGFLLSSNFIDGGVTGVSMLLNKTTGFSLSLCLVLVNLPFVVVGYRSLGAVFAVRSIFAISALAVTLQVIPFPDVTPDLVLTSVFGGAFLGAGIGLAIRGGAVLDGTEIAALLISKRSSYFRVGDVILGFNVVIFLVAMALLGVEPALYSILTYLTAARTLDFVVYGLEEFTAITIVSEKSAAIRKMITSSTGRGVTVIRGYSGVREREQDILYCVVTRLEIGRVKEVVHELDASAFLTIHTLSDAVGGRIKRTPLH